MTTTALSTLPPTNGTYEPPARVVAALRSGRRTSVLDELARVLEHALVVDQDLADVGGVLSTDDLAA